MSWGAAAGLVLTNVVCPQNLTAYTGLDFAGSRLAADGLEMRYGFPALAVEALRLPLFTPARLPGEQAPRTAFFTRLRLIWAAHPYPCRFHRPLFRKTIGTGEYGLRVSAYYPGAGFFPCRVLRMERYSPFQEESDSNGA